MLKDRALAAAAEGITIADARSADRPLIYVNEGFVKLTGYSIEEALGSNCRFLQGPDTDPEAVREIREAIAEERGCEVELLNYRKDGVPFWNRLSITPVRDDAGRTTHFVGVQSDVTRRRQAEQELRKANERLVAVNRRMRLELQAAAHVQQALLPRQMPELENIKIGWAFLPCEELAGDILDVLPLDEHRAAVYLLDVSGHGVQSALLATSLNHWLSRMPKKLRQDPVAVLNDLNRAFQIDPTRPQFFTCCYAVLDSRDQSLEFVSAGHPPPILVRDYRAEELDVSGFPVGIVEHPEYQLTRLDLQPGDRIYMYSDGVTEQMDASGNMFGSQRLCRQLLGNRAASLQSSIDEALQAVLNTTNDGKNNDDVSMLGIALLG
ncbi:MAG: SpoIIE family protein phosphatase [bacterium]|nr:SpoIIE family protein phosphatase [bacterium]